MMTKYHNPVLLTEVLNYLDIKPNQNFIDGTLGGGNYTTKILTSSAPKGKVLAFDLDMNAHQNFISQYPDLLPRVILVKDNFANLKQSVVENSFNNISGLVLDLGLSMHQLQQDSRGFTFKKNEPLNMAFEGIGKLSAQRILSEYELEQLKKMFYNYGELANATALANKIIKSRSSKIIKTTSDLADIALSCPYRERNENRYLAKVFQALRIEVNDELENLKVILRDAIEILDKNARIAVVSYHSLEDRIVKHFFKKESINCICPPEIPVCRCEHKASLKIITKKPITPSEQEIYNNPSARSAKLRVAKII